MVYTYIVGSLHRWCWFLIPVVLVVAGVSLFAFSGAQSPSPGAVAGLVAHPAPPPRYTLALTLGPDTEWRFAPHVLDLNGDGVPDLVATARLADPALHIWWGNGQTFTPAQPTWTNIAYGALATGDVNHDGVPDIVE